MELYGLASALLHDDIKPSKLHVHFNPICLTDGKREAFTPVADLAYKETFDIRDIESSCRAFVTFVNRWEMLGQRQKDGLIAQGRTDLAEKLPLAVLVGDAAANQLNINALFFAFTGHGFLDDDSLPRESIKLGQAMEEALKRAIASFSELNKKMFPDDEFLRDETEAMREQLRKLENKRESPAELVKKVARARKKYLNTHGAYPADFIEACGKLPQLLDASFLHHGRYGHAARTLGRRTPVFTGEIRSLAERYKAGDAAAFRRLETIAAELGSHYGDEFTLGSKVFKLSARKNFANDAWLQEEYPEDAFFHWQDAQGNLPFKEAFHRAFRERNWHPSYRYIKLPMDGNSAMYTDPVADMVMEIFQIAQGTRDIDSIKRDYDDPDYHEDHEHKHDASLVAEHTHRIERQRHEEHVARLECGAAKKQCAGAGI